MKLEHSRSTEAAEEASIPVIAHEEGVAQLEKKRAPHTAGLFESGEATL